MLDLQLPQTVTAVVLVLGLPLAVGLMGGLFVRPVLRSLGLFLKFGAIVGVALLLLGLIRADVARGYVEQLWGLTGAICGSCLRHLIDALAAYPVAIGTFIIGVAVGVYAREAWSRRLRAT